MFKTNILTTKISTILRMLSALVLISPMGVTANRSFIFNQSNCNALASIAVMLGCGVGFHYFFTTKEESSRMKRVLLFLAPVSIGIVLLFILNAYNNDPETRIQELTNEKEKHTKKFMA